MSLENAFDISLSGVLAQAKAMEYIASNIANANTTRTVDGGAYRRRLPIFSERPLSFMEELSMAEARLNSKGGVEVSDVILDPSPLQKVFKPEHPDADAQGFLSLPNVKLSEEMANMVGTSRYHEANITAAKAAQGMMQSVLQINM